MNVSESEYGHSVFYGLFSTLFLYIEIPYSTLRKVSIQIKTYMN